MTAASPEAAEWRFPNRATPVGSPPYYAVRFSPDALRERSAGLLAWFDLVEQVAERPVDPGVARLKLDWWRQEVSNLPRGEVRHPLATRLHEEGLGADAVAPMLRILEALDRRLRSPTIVDLAEFAADCRQTQGELFVVLAVAQSDGAFDARGCIEAGAYWAAVERVRLAAQRPQRLPPPLQPQSIGRLDRAQRVARLDGLLNGFPDDTPPARRPIPDVARRLTALAAAMHKKLRDRGYPVAEALIERAPLANLWTAWRCR